MSPKCLTNVNPKGRDLDSAGSTRIALWLGTPELESIDAFRKTVRKLTTVKLTRAHILREGARMFMERVNRDIRKANRGELHAKKRTENEGI